jgi:hypothetical protein
MLVHNNAPFCWTSLFASATIRQCFALRVHGKSFVLRAILLATAAHHKNNVWHANE